MQLESFDVFMLVICAFMDAASVFGQTVAFQKSPSGFVSLISFINVVYALIADYYIFEEKVNQSEIIAASTIFCTTLVVAVFKIMRDL